MFGQALQRNPDDGECFVGRARVLVRLGQRQAAIADYWRGLERLREPQPEYVVELAQALTAEGQVAEALRALDEGIKKLGPIVPLQGYALELELGRKNNDAALARLETILARALRKESWFARRGEDSARGWAGGGSPEIIRSRAGGGESPAGTLAARTGHGEIAGARPCRPDRHHQRAAGQTIEIRKYVTNH